MMLGSIELNGLDVNDGVNYAMMLNAFKPRPAVRQQRFITSPLRDGSTLKKGGRKENTELPFDVKVLGTSPADLDAKLVNLLLHILDEEITVMHTPTDKAVRYYDAYCAPEIDTGTYWEIEYDTQNEARVIFVLPCLPDSYGDWLELKPLEEIGQNNNFAEHTGDVFDHWTAAVYGGATITADTTNYKHGDCAVRFQIGRVVNKYTVRGSGLAANKSPKNWTLQGSNDATFVTWDTLDTQTNQVFALDETKTYTIANTTPYRWYRINITLNNGGATVLIKEMRLYNGTTDITTNLTSNALPAPFGAAASTEGVSTPAYYAFDNAANGWEATAATGWLRYDFGEAYASLTDTAFIPVDSSKHYQSRMEHKYLSGSGSRSLEVKILCYNNADTLLGTLTQSSFPSQSTYDYWYDALDNQTTCLGLIHPAGSADLKKFYTGTTKIKRQIKVSATASASGSLVVDFWWFACVENLIGNRASGVLPFKLTPEMFDGTVPAKMDVHIDPLYNPFTALIVGQRDEYHADWNPVLYLDDELHAAQGRHNADVAYVTMGASKVSNGDFGTYTGSGNTTDWSAWTETRTGATAYLGADTADYIDAPASAKMYFTRAVSNGLIQLLSDVQTIDPANSLYLRVSGKRKGSGVVLNSYVDVLFYNVAHVYVGYKRLYYGNLSTGWTDVVNTTIQPAQFPAGTAEMKLRILRQGSVSGATQQHLWDTIYVGQQTPSPLEVSCNVGANKGKYLPSLSFTVPINLVASHNLTLQTQLATVDGEITDLRTDDTLAVGNPNGMYTEAAMQDARLDTVEVPSFRVSSNADEDGIDQKFRFVLPASWPSTTNFYLDAFTLIPYDRAICEVYGWPDTAEHLILNSTAKKPSVMVSLDGTVDSAQIYSPTNYNNAPRFEADPNGVNLLILSIRNDGTAGDALTPISNVTLRYRPRYVMVP